MNSPEICSHHLRSRSWKDLRFQITVARTMNHRTLLFLSKKQIQTIKIEEITFTTMNHSNRLEINLFRPQWSPTIKSFRWYFWTNPSSSRVFQLPHHLPKTKPHKKNQITWQFTSLHWAVNSAQESLDRSSLQSTYYWKFRHIKTGLLFALKRIDKNNIDHKLLIQLIR